MIRNGATDNILQYLSSSEVLRLKNVVGGQWEGMGDELCPCSPPNSSLRRFQPAHTFLSGYNAPRNLQHYALYLDTRIRAYRDLKHDAIRVQSETNRDIRLSMSIEEDARQTRKYTPEEDRYQPSGDSSKRKTIMGRKLRIMTVEKGLLRETKVVQKMMDALIECKVSFNFCLFGDPLLGTHAALLSFTWMTWRINYPSLRSGCWSRICSSFSKP